MDNAQLEKIKVSLTAIATKHDVVGLKFPPDYPTSDLTHVSKYFDKVFDELGILVILGREDEFDLTKLSESKLNKAGWYRKNK